MITAIRVFCDEPVHPNRRTYPIDTFVLDARSGKWGVLGQDPTMADDRPLGSFRPDDIPVGNRMELSVYSGSDTSWTAPFVAA